MDYTHEIFAPLQYLATLTSVAQKNKIKHETYIKLVTAFLKQGF